MLQFFSRNFQVYIDLFKEAVLHEHFTKSTTVAFSPGIVTVLPKNTIQGAMASAVANLLVGNSVGNTAGVSPEQMHCPHPGIPFPTPLTP